MKHTVPLLFACILVSRCSAPDQTNLERTTTYDELVELFKSWRQFQAPISKAGIPDYSVAAMKNQREELKSWQQRLQNFDTVGWPIKHQVDWYLIYAEMNGLDFDHRVLRTWERDPAFYKTLWTERSDVPGHEGPTHHHLVELWTYQFPLTSKSKKN